MSQGFKNKLKHKKSGSIDLAESVHIPKDE